MELRYIEQSKIIKIDKPMTLKHSLDGGLGKPMICNEGTDFNNINNDCKKYLYTDQPERLSNLLGMLDIISICPVIFEMFERLKKEYGFERR